MPRKKPQQLRRLRRYGNCRLYDPKTGACVFAEDLKRLRAEGFRVSVRDAETSQDATGEYMSQRVH